MEYLPVAKPARRVSVGKELEMYGLRSGGVWGMGQLLGGGRLRYLLRQLWALRSCHPGIFFWPASSGCRSSSRGWLCDDLDTSRTSAQQFWTLSETHFNPHQRHVHSDLTFPMICCYTAGSRNGFEGTDIGRRHKKSRKNVQFEVAKLPT